MGTGNEANSHSGKWINLFCIRVGAFDEHFYATAIGDQLDFYIVFTQVGKQIFNVPEHLVSTALAGLIKMENHTVLFYSCLPSFDSQSHQPSFWLALMPLRTSLWRCT